MLLAQIERDTTVAATGPMQSAGAHVPRDVLSVPLDLVVVRTAVWRAALGLAEDLGDVLTDIDLGWRFWLLGYRVREHPGVILSASSRAEVSDDELATARASLLVAFRNFSDATLGGLLSLDGAALGSTPLRADTAPYGSELPGQVAARVRIQRDRRIPDSEVLPLLRAASFPLPWDTSILEAAGRDDLISDRRRILVITGDTLGAKMAGPAIRAWEMAGALSVEHDVVLGTLGDCGLNSDRFEVRHVAEAAMRELEAWCDVIVFQGLLLGMFPWLLDSEKIIVADIYDPFHLETLEQERHQDERFREAAFRGALEAITVQLERGDFFLCASDKQRDLWLGHLAALGRIGPRTYDGDENLERLLAVAPFGLAATPPRHHRAVVKGVHPGISEGDTLILWGGGIYNWFDPLTLISAIGEMRETHPTVKLLFLGTQHPNPQVPTMRMAVEARDLAKHLGLLDTHVFFNEGWVPYDDRQNYLTEADIGVSCHYDHVETEFSFRTRILDYLWAGLPIVTTGGDTFGDLVHERELGVSVPAEDLDALVAALTRLVDDSEFARACRRNVEAVAQEFIWARAMQPLVEFCRAPRRARDRSGRRPDPAQGLPPRPRTLRSEAKLVVEYLRAGGVYEVVRRVRGRLRPSALPTGPQLTRRR